MKRIQGKNIVGYVIVQVKGEEPELFFQACADRNIPIWDLKKESNSSCTGKIYLVHVKKINELMEDYPYEVTISNKKGYIHFLSKLWRRKEILISLLLSSFIIFFLSNIIWKIEINGISANIEDKLHAELTTYGLYEGAWIRSHKSLDIIQHELINEMPELLYIGIEKKGTTYYVDAVEKLIVDEREQLPHRHLIAAKNGIIQKMFIKTGLPVVQVNDYVSKGDLLVSGIIDKQKDQEDAEDDKDMPKEIVAADGKVYANTWYEVNVNSALYHSSEKLLGDKKVQYYIRFGNFDLPIWGFWNKKFKENYVEVVKKPIYFMKWKMPIQFIQEQVFNKASFSESRTVEEAKEIAINHVKQDLQVKLGKDLRILKYYVLHETEDNGKVKLNLYVSVLEDIAKGNLIQ